MIFKQSEMNGPIAQVVALTCHGNAFLQGNNAHAFFPDNSTCVFCDRVTFVSLEKTFFGKTKEKAVAQTPQDWFAYLKSSGAMGIRILREPQNDPRISDRMSAGFVGGGGTWYMEVVRPKGQSEFWLARWEVWNQEAPEQRIWRVTYGQVSDGPATEIEPVDIPEAASRLADALREIHAFSAKHDCGGFTQCFAEALDTLDSAGEHLHGYHQDLVPSDFVSSQARTLLDACQKAWVFGGMGSWNDMGFDDPEQAEYERVSEQLFHNLNEAIAAGANDSYQSTYSGMTTNERLFAAGLLDDFDAAARRRDRQQMIAILQRVRFDAAEAASITDAMLEAPSKYGF